MTVTLFAHLGDHQELSKAVLTDVHGHKVFSRSAAVVEAMEAGEPLPGDPNSPWRWLARDAWVREDASGAGAGRNPSPSSTGTRDPASPELRTGAGETPETLEEVLLLVQRLEARLGFYEDREQSICRAIGGVSDRGQYRADIIEQLQITFRDARMWREYGTFIEQCATRKGKSA